MKTVLVFKIFIIFFLILFTVNTGVGQQNSIDHWETIIFSDQTWNYFVGTSEPDSHWREITFDDSSWLQGVGGIGYGDGDDRTIISRIISLYLRINFNVIDISKIVQAVLHVDYDDAFVAYINDVEVARSNIGVVGDHPAYNETAHSLHEAEMYQGGLPEEFVINKKKLSNCLKEGKNILALQVHNESLVSSDLSSTTFLSVGISDTTFTYGHPPTWFMPPVSFTSSNLPIVVFNTNGQTIIDDPRIVADMGIIYNGPGKRNHISDPFNEYDGNISIEIRGSSSQEFPKKSYGLETQDSLGNNNNVSLLGMPRENDWILYAPYSDKSLMRNVLTFRLSNDMGRYAPRTRFCELVLNGNYQGVYVLMESIKRDKNRVDIAKLTVLDVTGDDLSGGYIIKIDKFTGSGGDGWASPYPPYPGATQEIFFQYHYPKAREILDVQRTYIQHYVTEFETVLIGPHFTDPIAGYRNHIDVDSFIDFLIVTEIGKNVDGYNLSIFMYKDKDSKGGKLTMGPLWDFNLAFGNVDYCGANSTVGFQLDDYQKICALDDPQIPFWWYRLLEDSTFRNELKCRWEELRNGPFHTDTIMAYIDSVAVYLDEAQQRNFRKWKILDVWIWPNDFVGKSYQEEVEFLKFSWLSFRLDWMDANMPGTCSSSSDDNIIINNIIVYPNPSYMSTIFKYRLVETEKASIKIYNILGQEIISLVNKNQGVGIYTVIWDGKDKRGSSIASGIYICTLEINDRIMSSHKLIKF